MIELEKTYDASKVEKPIYEKWVNSGFFNPDNWPDKTAPTFSIVLPPPNVTGTLHVGHALTATIEDILVRYKRMQGFRTLWLPGTDHAPIATESKVAKLIEKEEGKRKKDFTREEFIKRVEAFAKNSHDTIVNQLKAMGASLDWSRESYTFDEERSLAVRTAFKRLYDMGLIYRGNRVINWDVKGQTTISDDEIVYVERPAKLYTFKYSEDFPISIATTRPETKIGDTAVAVNPKDERYKQYIGQEYDLDFFGAKLHIKIIGDDSIDMEFGTGALGVTPAHSTVDYEMLLRHNLPLVAVIDEYGKMTAGNENILGKKTIEAREAIVEGLRNRNLLEKEEDITQNVGTAERTGGIIEPLPKLQWFIDVNKEFNFKDENGILPAGKTSTTLKELMRLAVKPNQAEIIPEYFSKTYFHWIDNLRDWCISRQIWFGHRIPVWYKGDEILCDINPPKEEGWQQDPDTLDTWFSSGLWTFSTLGWPNNTSPDFLNFHPTDVLETGYDILFFWVARMILLTTVLTGQIPFKKVFLHGIIRDAEKKKMSKSTGNVIDPLDMTAKYGTDALRFALIFNTAPGTDMALAEDKIKGMKHFANKLWNIARFILGSVENFDAMANLDQVHPSTDADKTVLEKLNSAIAEVTVHLDEFRLHEAAQSIYQFTWNEFADVYIEASKEQLKDPDLKEHTEKILAASLINILKLLHPFMPFVTEEIWSKLGRDKLLMVAKWPEN
jgi:valyl-tRNA synthetase